MVCFLFFKREMKVFSKQESVVLLNPILYSWPFLLKKNQGFTWNKNFPSFLFFPLVKLQCYKYLSLRDLIMKNWEKLSPQIIGRGKLRGRATGRKAIFQSLWLWNFKAPKAFFCWKLFWGDCNSHHWSFSRKNLFAF